MKLAGSILWLAMFWTSSLEYAVSRRLLQLAFFLVPADIIDLVVRSYAVAMSVTEI